MTVSSIGAIIFDMDGVITDTDELHYQTWQQVAEEAGITFSREKYARMSGKTYYANRQIFTEGLDLDADTVQALMDRKQAYFAARRDQLTKNDILEGIPALIEDAKAQGLKLGVGSSSRNARPILEQLDLIQHFDVIGDAYSVVNSKPAPDIFLWVAGGLGVKPSHCLVLEDAFAGVEAARQGGFYVIGIHPQLALTQAHVQIASTAQRTLDDLFSLLSDAI